MREDQIRRMEEQLEELERLTEKEKRGELTDDERRALVAARERARNETIGSTISSVVVVVALIGGFIWWMSGSESEPSAPQAAEAPDYASDATYVCIGAVRERLKAPSTADFILDSRHVRRDGGVFHVDGQVDAQNSFGAMIRQPYTCRVFLDGDGWRVLDVGIGSG